MIHDPGQLLAWLRANTARDRVLNNALNTGEAAVTPQEGGWHVRVTSRRGNIYGVRVVADPVGMPCRWYRSNE